MCSASFPKTLEAPVDLLVTNVNLFRGPRGGPPAGQVVNSNFSHRSCFFLIRPVKGQIFKHECTGTSKLPQVKVNFKKCPGQMVMLKMAQVNRSNLPPRGPQLG